MQWASDSTLRKARGLGSSAHCATKSGVHDRDYLPPLVEMMARFPNLYADLSALNLPFRSAGLKAMLDNLPKVVEKFSALEDQVKKVVTNAGALTEKVKANPSLLLRRPEKKEE